jgi:putative endonuclease
MNTTFWVYIISNLSHSTFCTGMMSDLHKRMDEHKTKTVRSFSQRYNCTKRLYYERFEDLDTARHREHQLKRYRRIGKENLITELNSTWKDLSDDF